MKLSDFLEGVGRPVAYYPSLSRALGDIKVAIFVCQMAYWRGKESDPDGWIYKESEEIDEETGLSYKEQIRIRAYLLGRKLLEERYARTEHKMYFRVNWDAVNQLWDEYMTNGHMPNGQVPAKHIPDSQKPSSQKSNGSRPNGSSLNSNTETTPDITKENKDILLRKIELYADSVFPDWKTKNPFMRRLDTDSISLTGAGKQITITGLSAEAEVWESRYYQSFANLGLELEFRS